MGRLYGVINLMQSAFLFSNDSRTGSPCPVLQYPISVLQQEVRVFTPLSSGEGLEVGLFILVVGGRGTETTVLLRFAMLTIVEQGLCALFSSTQYLFSSKKWGYSLPSPAGRGWGWGCIFWVLEYRAQRPCTTMFGSVRIGAKWFCIFIHFLA